VGDGAAGVCDAGRRRPDGQLDGPRGGQLLHWPGSRGVVSHVRNYSRRKHAVIYATTNALRNISSRRRRFTRPTPVQCYRTPRHDASQTDRRLCNCCHCQLIMTSFILVSWEHHTPCYTCLPPIKEAGPKISQNVNYTQRGTMEGPKAPSEAWRREAPECRGSRVWGGAQ